MSPSAIEPSRPSTSVPFPADSEPADSAVQLRSQDASLPRSPSSKENIFGRPVPVITPDAINFPADNTFRPPEKSTVSSQRPSTQPSSSAPPSSQRAAPSPSQTSYPAVRSTFAYSAMDLASALISPSLSSSLTRNPSIPAPLFPSSHSPHTPASSIPVTQSRPSLSSPSPPTPIVPSIPLRHATQHSPVHSLTGLSSPPATHASHPDATSPLDRRFPSVKFPADQSPTTVSFATASDPNLSSWSYTTTPDLNQYSLPLKKLLAKPARLSALQLGDDADGVDLSWRHQRTTSVTESVRFSSHSSVMHSIERAAASSFQDRPASRDRSSRGHYHYQRATENINTDYQNQGRGHRFRASGDQPRWWPGLKQSDSKPGGTGKGKANNPPRNVLKRRPSNSLKATEPRSPTRSGSQSLSRSLSASSLLKRAGFLKERSPSVLLPSSPAPDSPSPQPSHPISLGSPAPPLVADTSNPNESDNHSAHSHVEHASAQSVHKANINRNMVTSNDTPASSLPTDPLTLKSVSKEPSPAFPQPTPSPQGVSPISGTRLSTISSVSGSSAGSKSREKVLSPAGSIAEAFKRELLRDESDNSSPSGAVPSPSPNLPTTAESLAEKAADSISTSKRSSNSGLSYADTKAHPDNVMQTRLDGDVKADAKTTTQEASLEVDGVMVRTSVVTRSSMHPSVTSTPTPTFSPRSSVSSPHPSSEHRTRNRLKKSRHTSDQIDGFRPYYTVVGERSERIFSVGGPRDSLGEDWGIRTTITAGRPRTSDGIKERVPFSKSLSRKLSGKFKREQSPGPDHERPGTRGPGDVSEEGLFGKSLTRKLSGKLKQDRPARESYEQFEAKAVFGDNENASFGKSLSRKLSAKRNQNRPGPENDETMRGRSMRQDRRATSTVPSRRTFEDIPRDPRRSEDRCLPYFYSPKKDVHSETDIAGKEKSNGKFPKFWRLFGRSRSKSRDPNIHSSKSEEPPPLPALPKYPIPDHRDIHVAPPPRKTSQSSKSSPSTPSARPSTATSENAPRFWNRPYSAPSSTSSLDIPPTPSPRVDLKRYATTDNTHRSQNQKHAASNATRSPRTMQAEVQQTYQAGFDIERSDSPPIPSFSTVDTINSFPPRPSSDRSKNSPTSVSTPSPTSPPARAVRKSSSRHLKDTDTRRNTFGDEALYPPVMKPSTPPSPKMTYRELAPGKGDAKLTEKEKADRWVALLEKSDAAGGTLHFGGTDDKLPSDELRFSRTLSELARDDD